MLDFGAFKSLSTREFQEKKAEGCAVIDIRRPDEWEYYGVIEGSHKITFFDNMGEYDIETFMKAFTEVVTQKDQPFVLVCAHANRTKSIGKFLGGQMGYTNVFELDEGINYGWIDQGLETVH